MTYWDIECCLTKGRASARVDISSKYREKPLVTLVKNEYFFARALALASLRLVHNVSKENDEVGIRCFFTDKT